MADASAYYLVGYAPTRQLSDGKFHKIHVRVKRSGVRVTARRGYWAPTEAESNPEPAPPADPDAHRRPARAGDAGRPDRRLIDMWVGTEPADYGLSKVHVSWEAGAAVRRDRPGDGGSRAGHAHRASLLSAQTIGTAPKEGDARDGGLVPARSPARRRSR